MDEPRPSIRLDKWLWQARFFKARSISAKVVSGGHVRVNGSKVHKPATSIKPGDTLIFPQARIERTIKVLAIGTRRGPAPEAQALYEDLTPVVEASPKKPEIERKGRPTKQDRRAIDKIKRSWS